MSPRPAAMPTWRWARSRESAYWLVLWRYGDTVCQQLAVHDDHGNLIMVG